MDGINSQVVSNTGAINQFKITENEISQSMKDAQGNIETLKLTAKSFEQKFADTDGNIASVKRSATELSEQLASKVSNTEYQNFKTQTAKELSEKLVRSDLNGYATTAEVKLTADGLKEQYNSVNSKVDGLKIGGVNLLNSTKTLDKMDGNVSGGLRMLPSNINKGSYNGFATSIVNAGQTSSYAEWGVVIEPGETYTFSFYAKGKQVYAYFYGPSNYIGVDNGNTPNGDFKRVGDGLTIFNLTSEYKRYWVTWKVREKTGDSQPLLKYVLLRNDSAQGPSEIWGWQLEKGTIPSDWGPSAKDVEDAISGVNKDLTNYKAVVERDYAKNSSVYTKNEVVNLTNSSRDSAVNAIKTDANWKGLVNINTNSSFLQTAEGFEKEVVKKATPMVEGGGVNLVRNSGNPQTTDGWRIWGANTSHRFIVNRHNFWKNAQETLFTLFNANSSEVSIASNRVNVERNAEYTLSYWAFEDSNVTSSDTYFVGRKNGETSDTKVVGLVTRRVYSTVKAEYVTVTFNTGEVDEGYIRFDNNGSRNVGHEGGLYLANIKLEKGTVATPWTPAPEDLATVVSVNKVIDTADSHTQIIKDYLTNDNSQFKLLKNAVNLKVEKGDVIGQINLEAGKTLLQNKKIYLDADTVAFSGKAFIPSAAITELSADKITTGTLNAAAVKVINLDANNITTGKLNGMAVKIDGKTSEIDMTTDRGVIFRQKNGTWATTLTSGQIQFENNSSGQSEILGSLTAAYNTESKNINGIGIVIPTHQKLGAPYGGDEFSIGYATDRNGHTTSDFIYNASGQVRSKGFHWYESSHLYGNAQVLYIDGAHDPLWIRGTKFDNSTQNGYYQPTVSAGWGRDTYGNSGISFLWDSVKAFGTLDLAGTSIRGGNNYRYAFDNRSWSDWGNRLEACLSRTDKGCGIVFGSDGNMWAFGAGSRKKLT